jgi:hypothetical protein
MAKLARELTRKRDKRTKPVAQTKSHAMINWVGLISVLMIACTEHSEITSACDHLVHDAKRGATARLGRAKVRQNDFQERPSWRHCRQERRQLVQSNQLGERP